MKKMTLRLLRINFFPVGAVLALCLTFLSPAPPARACGRLGPPAAAASALEAGTVDRPLVKASSSADPDLYESDDGWPSARPISQLESQAHNFHAAYDEDWAWIEVYPYGEDLFIYTDYLGSQADTVIELYGPQPADASGPGPLVKVGDDSANCFYPASSLVDTTGLPAGIYFIRVYNFNGDVYGADTDYALAVTVRFLCGFELAGLVTSAADGAPIPGAQVEVYDMYPNEGTTDQDGFFDVEYIMSTMADVMITSTGFQPYLEYNVPTAGVYPFPACLFVELQPNGFDSDGDGLLDSEEITASFSDPYNPDTDGDALPDGFEFNTDGLDPLDDSDALLDFDSDQNPNVHEYYNGTDLIKPDPATHQGHVDYACAYWGDADGNCVVTSADRTVLVSLLMGFSSDFTNTIPHDEAILDLNGNGSVESSDRTIMQVELLQLDPGAIGSRPTQIEVIDQPAAALAVGDTCHVTVQVRNSYGNLTSGLAVKFMVDPTSTADAAIFGGDGENNGDRYDYTGPTANIVIRADSSGTINLVPVIETCGTPGVGRYLDTTIVSPDSPVVIAVTP